MTRLNILICGTPGTGKSTIASRVNESIRASNYIILSRYAIQKDCVDGFDENLNTHIINEDKLLGLITPMLDSNKLNLIESIHGDIIPSSLIDWTFVCQTDNTILYDRLKERGYDELKIRNNVEAEIFQTVLEEVREFHEVSKYTILINNTKSDLEENIETARNKINELLWLSVNKR